jgi:hypothetical protein
VLVILRAKEPSRDAGNPSFPGRHLAEPQRLRRPGRAFADGYAAKISAPDQSEAPRRTRVTWSSRSERLAGPRSRGRSGSLSLMNTTPWPTMTSSSMVTPSKMKLWLWILQRGPIEAPCWISTKARSASRRPSCSRSGGRMSRRRLRLRSEHRSMSRYGASLADASAIEELPDRGDGGRELCLRHRGRSATRVLRLRAPPRPGNALGTARVTRTSCQVRGLGHP